MKLDRRVREVLSGLPARQAKEKARVERDAPKPLAGRVAGLIADAQSGKHHPLYKRLAGDDAKLWELKRLVRSRGERYADATLESFEIYDSQQTPVINDLRMFCEEMPTRLRNGAGLTLMGRSGTGKDHCQMACMKAAIIAHGLTVEWHDGVRLGESFRHAISKGEEHKMITRLCKAQVLAISDPVPARGQLSDYQLAILRQVVDWRYSRSLSTWITTNLEDFEQAKQMLTVPLLERLTHGALELFFNWPSYRMRT